MLVDNKSQVYPAFYELQRLVNSDDLRAVLWSHLVPRGTPVSGVSNTSNELLTLENSEAFGLAVTVYRGAEPIQ